MVYIKWTKEEWDFCLKCFKESGSGIEALRKMQTKYPHRSRSSIQNKFMREGASMVAKKPPKALTIKEKIESNLITEKLRKENNSLKSELQELRREILSTQGLLNLVHGIQKASFLTTPPWLSEPSRKGLTGIPVLLLSDIHFDEYVDPLQIGGVNSYNHEIAVKRIKNVFQNSIKLCLHHMNKPQYDGFVCAFGGDILSGNIHEELAETNEFPILQSAVDLMDLLICGLKLLADNFGKVFVPCVVGNHGRLHQKPRSKNRVKDNYEWIVYHSLAKHFAEDKRITFYVPESSDAIFSIYNKTFLLTHGDQFKGGSGISGVFSPLFIGQARKQRRQQAVKKGFDAMLIGHWHQYIHTETLVVNGSMIGYNEYAYINNFSFEQPQQAMFIMHPDLGVTYRVPVLCDTNNSETIKQETSIKIW